MATINVSMVENKAPLDILVTWHDQVLNQERAVTIEVELVGAIQSDEILRVKVDGQDVWVVGSGMIDGARIVETERVREVELPVLILDPGGSVSWKGAHDYISDNCDD